MTGLGRAHRLALGGMLLVVALSLRPYFDLTGGDFPFYLQAKSFAELRADVPVPEGATELPTMMALKDGRLYSHYPPGTSLLLAPFYAAGHALDLATGTALGRERIAGWTEGRFAILAVTAANLVFLAGILLLVLRLASRLGLTANVAVAACGLVVFAAPFWYLSGHPNTHLVSTLLTLAATVLVFAARQGGSRPRLLLAGVAGAFAFLVRPMNVLVLAPLGLYVLAGVRAPIRSAGIFGSAVLLGPLMGFGLSYAMFGSGFASAYQYSLEFGEEGRQAAVLTGPLSGFTTPLPEGLAGMTIGAISEPRPTPAGKMREMVLPGPFLHWDQVRGLLLLMPVLLFAVPGFLLLRRQGHGAEAAVLAAQLVLLLVAHAMWFYWYANPHTPLPTRFLCDAYPGSCVAIAAYSAEARGGWLRAVRFVTAWTVANQALVVASLYVNVLIGVNPIAVPSWQVIVFLLFVGGVASWRPGRVLATSCPR